MTHSAFGFEYAFWSKTSYSESPTCSTVTRLEDRARRWAVVLADGASELAPGDDEDFIVMAGGTIEFAVKLAIAIEGGFKR